MVLLAISLGLLAFGGGTYWVGVKMEQRTKRNRSKHVYLHHIREGK